MPCGVKTSIFGTELALTSSSTSRSSRWPPLQQLAQLLARVLVRVVVAYLEMTLGRHARGTADFGRRREQQIEQALLGILARLDRDAIARLVAHHLDRALGQVANHRLDVAADVADLGVARGLDLDERRLRQPREASRDFGLADAGRPDHQDILGRDFVAQLGRDILPPPSIAQRDRDCALRVMLPDDIAVELGDDLARRHYLWNCHRMKTSRRYCGYNSSNTNSSLV